MAGLRELDQDLRVIAVEPEIAAEDLLVPIGALGGEDNGVSVGRQFDAAEADGIEEVIERKFRLLRDGEQYTTQDQSEQQGRFLDP